MAVQGQVAPEYQELNDARESLARELERAFGDTMGVYMLRRFERFIDAKIAAETNKRY